MRLYNLVRHKKPPSIHGKEREWSHFEKAGSGERLRQTYYLVRGVERSQDDLIIDFYLQGLHYVVEPYHSGIGEHVCEKTHGVVEFGRGWR